MGRGDDPHVHVQRPLAPDALECAVLEDSQQPHLRGRRELAALVEEQRPAVGPLEPSLPRPDRPREAAALVAEQLGVDQVGRDGAAVDPQERAGGPPRPLVDRPRHDLLARTGLAQDQDRRVRPRDQLDLLHHRPQPGLRADDRIADVVPVQSREQRPLVGLERLAKRDQLAQPVVVLQRDGERLQQRLHQLFVLVPQLMPRRGEKQQEARRCVAHDQRSRQHLALEPLRQQAG